MTVALATRGMIWWGPYRVVTCARPLTHTVIEVRPSLRATKEMPAPDPKPAISSSLLVAPSTQAAAENEVFSPLRPPAITESRVLAPVIVSAEEEE